MIASFLAFLCLILSSCVATREDVAGLEGQIQSLEKSIGNLEKKQADLAAQLDAIKKPVSSLNSNLVDTQNLLANYTPRFEELRSQISGTRSEINQKIADLTVKLDDLSRVINAKLEDLKKSQSKTKAKANDNGEEGKKKEKPAAAQDTGSSLAVFQGAYKDYLAKRWDLAQAGFDEYRRKEPNGSLVDKSLYYSALAAKSAGNNKSALEYLEDIVAKFPKSPVAKSAMLEKAKIYLDDKRIQEAEGMLEYLIVSFPQSEEAAEAREILKKLPH